ncbi:hypothetical protein LEP1GSC058_0600 [Leptospira fainei serovar Hurstbridge str. BUT 6]|uniref:Dolichyl-phosphate-mannose-protein mannosyltransferase n=1 Tax=Leptospira fainei serovar Hurstbridge str. BUT 6 TaxID=1193011 RepID=S3W699_9LEPT|nr:hypothetical protein [Leptospira fainei]EPG75667.1 hypothetical protein LEP1GSC058_0600 [Leptospira fainei serovar Hurstbridge str. BUT 6]
MILTTKIRRSLSLILLAFVLFGSVTYLKPQYSFNWDIHNKAVQSFSLLKNQFLSEELFYPGRVVDPEFLYFPQQGNVFLQIQGRNLSAFPIAFAAISAPWIWLLGFWSLPYASAFGLLLCLIIFTKYWKPTSFVLMITVFSTFLWILSVEYSEHSVFILFSLLAITFTVKGNRAGNWTILLAGFFCGLTVWFRHEGLVYCASLAMWIFLTEPKIKFTFPLRVFLFCIGAGVTIGGFFLFNYFDYGHPLGPRYLINREGLSVPFLVRLDWAKSLLFLGGFKLGYFGYMPAALILFMILLFSWRKLSRSNRLIFGSTLTYILLVLAIVPNDGFTNWGPRFFGPVVFPFVILFSKYFYYMKKKRKYRLLKFILLACLGFSFLMGIFGIKFIAEGRKQQFLNNRLYNSTETDIWIFPDDSIAYMAGTDYFKKIVFRVSKTSDLEILLPKLQANWPGAKIGFFHMDRNKIDARMKEALKANPEFAESFRKTVWDDVELEKIVRTYLVAPKDIRSDRLRVWTGSLNTKPSK